MNLVMNDLEEALKDPRILTKSYAKHEWYRIYRAFGALSKTYHQHIKASLRILSENNASSPQGNHGDAKQSRPVENLKPENGADSPAIRGEHV